jgi:hypothetical protein
MRHDISWIRSEAAISASFDIEQLQGHLNKRHLHRPWWVSPPSLPACQMILDVTGDLFTHGRQFKEFDSNDRVIGLLGELPILGRLVP